MIAVQNVSPLGGVGGAWRLAALRWAAQDYYTILAASIAWSTRLGKSPIRSVAITMIARPTVNGREGESSVAPVGASMNIVLMTIK